MRFQLLDAFVRGVELTAQVRDQIDEPFGADPPLSHILFERVDGIHTQSILANPANPGNADFTEWTATNTGEVLRLVNRSGNRPSHEGAAGEFDLAIRLCRQAGFRRILLRGDTDFSADQGPRRLGRRAVSFLFGIDAMPNLNALAEDLPASRWVEWHRPPQYTAQGPPRQRPEKIKDQIVRQRGFETWTRIREEVAEMAYRPTACDRSYRLIMVRQTIPVEKGQLRLQDEVRYRFFVTNDRETAPRALVFKANDRCDQENLIAQLKGGVHALRAAVDNLVSNWAYRVMTAWAWNLKAWFALSVPEHPRHQAAPREQKRDRLRMEFKRFVNTIMLDALPDRPEGASVDRPPAVMERVARGVPAGGSRACGAEVHRS